MYARQTMPPAGHTISWVHWLMWHGGQAPVKYSDKICFKCKCESMRLRKPWSEIKADEAIEMALPVLEERDARRS